MPNIDIPNPLEWEPREYQLPLWRALEGGCTRAVGVWHRRAGKDTVCLRWVPRAMIQRIGTYWHLLPTLKQGRRVIWNGRTKEGKPFLSAFPEELIVKKRDDDMLIEFFNGSIYQVMGSDHIDSLVGANPIGVILSEYALQDPAAWDLLRPILAENGGWALFPYTPRGHNHGFRLFQMAKENPSWFCEKLTVDDTGAIPLDAVDEERKAGMSEALIQQEFYCFPSGTLIKTGEGHKPIEDIRQYDIVLSHAGRWRRVEETGSRPYKGDLISIRTYGRHKPLRCTPNHPVQVLDRSTRKQRWVPAGAIAKHDFLVMPRLNKGKPVLDRELVTLLAWFITEGSTAKGAVNFTLSQQEFVEHADIVNAARRYNRSTKLISNGDGSAVNVIVCSTQLADWLTLNCGSLSHNKRIPFGLIAGYEKEFFDMLMAGDGCIGPYSGATGRYTTVSEGLAYDVQLLASTLGYRAAVTRRPGAGEIMGRSVQARESYAVSISGNPKQDRKCAKIVPSTKGVGVRVRDVEFERFDGRVYNFSVQYDKSYVADGLNVHNCSFDAPIEGAYYAKQMMDALSEKPPRIGSVPFDPDLKVETWWDLGVGDATAIWFAQRAGQEIRLIDYHEESGMGLPHYAKILDDKAKEGEWIYGDHIAPHDIAVREVGTGRSRIETARGLGINFRVCPKIPVDDGINAVRSALTRCWFDEKNCMRGIDALRNYRKEEDEKRSDGVIPFYRDKPLHDWSSNGADSFRYGIVGGRRRPRHGKIEVPKQGIV